MEGRHDERTCRTRCHFPLSQPLWAARTHYPGDMMWRTAIAAVVTLMAAAPVFAQTGKIKGAVTAAEGGQPIADGQVRAGIGNGALTRPDGRYSLRGAPGNASLRV